MPELAYRRAWKIEGGYAVFNPLDAYPDLQGVVVADDVQSVPLLRTDDYGETWEEVGVFERSRFGDFRTLALYLEDENQ